MAALRKSHSQPVGAELEESRTYAHIGPILPGAGRADGPSGIIGPYGVIPPNPDLGVISLINQARSLVVRASLPGLLPASGNSRIPRRKNCRNGCRASNGPAPWMGVILFPSAAWKSA